MNQQQLINISGLLIYVLTIGVFLYFLIDLLLRFHQGNKVDDFERKFFNKKLWIILIWVNPITIVILFILTISGFSLFFVTNLNSWNIFFQVFFMLGTLFILFEILLISKKGNALQIIITQKWLILINDMIELALIKKINYDYKHKFIFIEIGENTSIDRVVRIKYNRKIREFLKADLKS
ncbi:hypothetical protein SSABA_v1c04660 [Spiroplasma sabaudiense Ar-1343]|uniref:Transmembrane protein n=1 Tax=Spiroplasma sabaudiense Ar-1343 TaxID=1276257 RepID=W6A9N5_9MOLU|nr:hypothetical protein [Spiroplasma sabaudiense]AHI53873.1 hypothetical protein SSABA_v1c04660 [Spiroplasma sabaudiense Ar-1343]